MMIPRLLRPFLALVVCALGLGASAASAEPLDLILPTENDALLRGDGPAFYMYTDRNFQGERSRPWEAGQYGFVRNPKVTSDGIVYTRFHEGVDIQPVRRDRSGDPLDEVRAIDGGTVVYANDVAGRSSYGKYVVVEHWWSGSPFYSLYAHLNAVHVKRGERLQQGDTIGRLGYTGRGINRRRAHLHFEINMLLNQHFESWYARHFRAANHHDVYNGFNLAGIDVAALYLALHADPTLTIDAFLKSQEPFYHVEVPNEGLPDLLHRYPWLTSWRVKEPYRYLPEERIASWEISFTRSGLPIRVEPSERAVRSPEVVSIQYHQAPYSYLTTGTISGSGDRFSLASAGERYLRLLTLCEDEHPAFQPPSTVAGPAVSPVEPVRYAPPGLGERPSPVAEGRALRRTGPVEPAPEAEYVAEEEVGGLSDQDVPAGAASEHEDAGAEWGGRGW